MKIFIGGSKTIGRLSPRVKKAITDFMAGGHDILLGDCYGVDLAVQHFLSESSYKKVTVYTACDKARHNTGAWNEKVIKTDKIGYSAHRQKDKAMIEKCDFAMMVWDGKTKGTRANIEELKKVNKKVVVFSENEGSV